MKNLLLLSIVIILLSSCGKKDNINIQVNEDLNSITTNVEVLSESEILINKTPAGESRIDSFGIEQVWVPAGNFIMGTESLDGLEIPNWAIKESQSEMPTHTVTITKGFWIDKFEVTNGNFQAFMDDGGYENLEFWSAEGIAWLETKRVENLPKKCTDEVSADKPQVCITWYEAEAYSNWRGGRLPTEAEWEFAARGPESFIYPWGNNWDKAKLNMVASFGLKKVGNYQDGASWVGAMDMAGNAMEWVQDWLDWNYYQNGDMVDPQGATSGSIKIEKGGWWGAPEFTARSAYRHFEDGPTYSDHHIGFRIVSQP